MSLIIIFFYSDHEFWVFENYFSFWTIISVELKLRVKSLNEEEKDVKDGPKFYLSWLNLSKLSKESKKLLSFSFSMFVNSAFLSLNSMTDCKIIFLYSFCKFLTIFPNLTSFTSFVNVNTYAYLQTSIWIKPLWKLCLF